MIAHSESRNAKTGIGSGPAAGRSGAEHRPMRVLFVSPGTDARGGAERSLLALLDGFAAERLDLDTRVMVLGHGSLVRELTNRGVACITVPVRSRALGSRHAGARRVGVAALAALPYLVRAEAAVVHAARRWPADIVHTNGWRAHLLAPALRLLGVPVVMSVRDLPQSAIDRLLVRNVPRAAALVIANSEVTADATGLSPQRVHVVSNPIEAPRSVPRDHARQALGLPPDAYVIANLAHFHEAKGQLSLVRALASLDDAHLVLAGGDLYGDASRRYRRTVEERITQLGLTARVRLLGAVEDVDVVYAAADIVVHAATRPEAFGRTIVEAMLARRPVVASTPGMPSRFVRDGETGLLYEPDDVASLVRHLNALEHDPQLREQLVTGAAAWAGEQFSSARAAAAVFDGYTSVVRNKRRCHT